MSLEKTNAVDSVGIDNESNFVAFTIADAGEWHDTQQHLLALQAKLNVYFRFIESGQIFESYPEAVGRQIMIDVVGKIPISTVGIEFLKRASDACTELGVRIRYRHYSSPSAPTQMTPCRVQVN